MAVKAILKMNSQKLNRIRLYNLSIKDKNHKGNKIVS